MRLRHALLASLVAFTCAEQLGLRHGLRIRQDSTPSISSDGAHSSAEPTGTGSEGSATPSPTDAPTKTGNSDGASQTGTQDGDATIPITATAPSDVPSPSSTVVLPGNSTTPPGELPIQPVLNPPLGVGGVILIITGLLLGLVGIKHRATQTFLSTSLLIALGCEVLVVYLMHPPVPVAVQGAYLVAGVVGGFLLGGLALIFKEMSEGFGCVLGGFCLAMWLLTLRPGGLITNSAGKIILIAMLCAGCYSLYISRFTRIYGLIFCTAFAGSTAFMLGVDFLSGAGLKEFWLYIWDLNDDEFPLFTETYPITRNMRVEIAAIVIVAFIGTMSQIKIWKIIKEQKSKRDAQRIADEEARDLEEAEVGRDVEDRNRETLAHWETEYDGKKGPTIEIDSKGVSLEDLSSDGTASRRHRESRPFSALMKRQSTSSLNLLVQDNQKRVSAVPSLPPLSFGWGENDSTRDGPATTGALTPATEPSTPGFGASTLSVNEKLSINDKRSMVSKRLSAMSLHARDTIVKRLSTMSLHAKDALDAAEDHTPFAVEEEDDLASSIAATAADAPDLDALSVRLSRPNSLYQSYANGTSPLQAKDEFIEDEDEEALWPAGGTNPGLPKHGLSGQGDAGEQAGAEGEKVALEERLPKKISKLALNYRTNEWAKEVSRADPEPIEETLIHDSDAVQIEMGNAAEAARAEENNAAPEPPPPPPAPAAPKPAKVAKVRSSAQLQRASSALTPTPVYAHSPTGSNDSWSEPLVKRASSNPLRASSNPVLSLTPDPLPPLPLDTSRNISMPMLDQMVVESPIEVERPKSRPSSALPKQINLLDERRDRLEKRLTTTSFMPAPAIPGSGPASESSAKDQTSGEGSQGETTEPSSISMNNEINEEDMTLAERKALVQQQAILQAQNADSAARPLNSRHMSNVQLQGLQTHNSMRSPSKPTRLSTGGSHQPIYDSHQPQRASSHDTRKQAVNWTQWRSSNTIATNSRNPYIIGDSQMDMLRAVRVQTETEAKIREQHKQAIQEQIDAHMRMGGMNDMHRKALAKMQGKANQNVQ